MYTIAAYSNENSLFSELKYRSQPDSNKYCYDHFFHSTLWWLGAPDHNWSGGYFSEYIRKVQKIIYYKNTQC